MLDSEARPDPPATHDHDMVRGPHLATYLWVCGVAVALGWGIRGQFGHERGAMIPGALAALAIALVSPDANKRRRVAMLGVAGGLGMAIGGSMSYGDLAGFLGKPGFHAICTWLLFVKGAVWGGFAGGVLGMALGNVRYAWKETLWLIPACAFYAAGSYLFPGSELSRHDGGRALTALLMAFLLWLRFVKRDRAAMLTACCAAIGFGFGFPFGSWLCVWGERTGIAVDWWKVAEMTWGGCGGLSLGLAAYVLDEDGVSHNAAQGRISNLLGLVYIAWLVPFWNGLNTMTYWVVERKVLPPVSLWAYVIAVIALLVAGIICLHRREPTRSPMRTTVYLLLWVAASTFALQFVKMAYPDGFRGGGFWWTQIAFVVCLALLGGYAIRRLRSANREQANA